MLLQGVLQIIHSHLTFIFGIIHTASRVNQFSILIEHIKMRCPKGSIRPRNILVLVVKVHPRELVFLHSCHHVVERVFRVGVLAV